MSMERFAVHSTTACGCPVPEPQGRREGVKLVLGSYVGGVASPSRWLNAVYFQKASAFLSARRSVRALSSEPGSPLASLVLIRL